ncbi:MAG: DJ-1/PfpI family protein [Bacteroidales bacterium]
MQTAFLFLATGFEETEAITPIDVLRRAGIELKTISVSNEKNVTGAHGITVVADQLLSETDFTNATMLILPGGMPGTTNLKECVGLAKLLKEQNAKGGYIAAICAAPLVLGGLGLLHNKKATCYPGFEKELIGAHVSADAVVKDGNIVTSKGPGTALEFALSLAALLTTEEKAAQIASAMIA